MIDAVAAEERAVEGGEAHNRRRDVWIIVGGYVVVVVVLLLAGNVALALWPAAAPVEGPDYPIIRTLTRWDTGWYRHIAEDGYFYEGPGRQSAVGFFPAYPALIRAGALVLANSTVAGVAVSLASGLAAFVALFRWCAERFDRDRSFWTVALLGSFPFAYYLFGVMYAEALFVAACVIAFLLLERDLPLLAGLAGAVATATRPVGIALIIGLAVRAVERRGSLRALRPKDAGVLVSAAGISLFCAYLWWRFDDPFAYTKVKAAAGWNQDLSANSVLKLDFFRRWRDHGASLANVVLTVHGIASVIAVALLPRVVRRLGWGYAAFSAVVIGIPLVTSLEFLAMGRYILPAFPIFAVAADATLHRSRGVRIAIIVVNGALLVWLTTLFARWYLLS